MVYSGSNGGKMHGFAESSGREVLAFIANNLFSTGTSEGLHYLTDPNYVHRYYNDLTPTVSDVFIYVGSGNEWQTVLISGQRGGGRGIFALNVTDPNSFSEANAADIVKGVKGAIEKDLKLSQARRKLDWEAQKKLVIDPDKFEEIRNKRKTKYLV